ncbi:KATNB1-like protein 1 isoform X2 [Cetorhinus maximus]
MASRHQDVRQGVLSFGVEDECFEKRQLAKRMHPDCNETMKKVRISECKEENPEIKRSSTGQTEKTLHRTSKATCYKKKSRHRVQSNVSNGKQHPSLLDCEMANKENEVVCSGTVPKLSNDNRSSLLNSSDSPASQTGATVTYADYFAQISKDHATMTQVLFGRNLRLNVALTFWQKSASELVAYLVRDHCYFGIQYIGDDQTRAYELHVALFHIKCGSVTRGQSRLMMCGRTGEDYVVEGMNGQLVERPCAPM